MLNARIVLEALCYSLQQAFTNEISICEMPYTDEVYFKQVHDLVTQIDEVVKMTNMCQDLLNMITWFDKKMYQAIKSSTTWIGCKEYYAILRDVDVTDLEPDLEEAYLEEDIEDAKSNMPCDTFGMLACGPTCPIYYECKGKGI